MGNLTNFIHPSVRVGAKNTKEGLGLGAGDRPDSFQSFIIKNKVTVFFFFWQAGVKTKDCLTNANKSRNPLEKQSPQKQLGKKQTKDEMRAHREGQHAELQVKPIRARGTEQRW